jgi:hypothetical protein
MGSGESVVGSVPRLWPWPKAAAAWPRLALWLAVLLAGTLGHPVRAAQGISEYEMKAVFLFNFVQFVEWPPAAFAGPEAPVIIGVLGEDPFGTMLDDTVRGERVNNRPIAVRRFRRAEEIDVCHVLFISRSEMPRLRLLIDRLKDRPILTVSDADGFAQRGGMIRLVTENSKVRMRVNPDAARAAGLVISSKLLRPATIVSPGTD